MFSNWFSQKLKFLRVIALRRVIREDRAKEMGEWSDLMKAPGECIF